MPRTASDRDGGTAADKAAYQPRSEDVVNWLRAAIEDGRLRPGERIGQETIAAELGVSRIPVREALRRLELEGLVVNPPHRSARVAPLDFAECEEIYKMRERLEPLALSESIAHVTDDQVEEAADLATALQKMHGDPTGWLMADRQLHLACYAGVQTPRLLDLIVGFWSTTQQYRRVLLSTFGDRDYEVQHMEHELMIDALAKRNPRAGEDLVRAHIERSRLRLAHNRDLFSS
ncbi:MAG: GntR family transcriptional regulator [Actinobacteria bacterium]|nr:GntR family transcriptional regulator [Actinomycetota bacterium]